MGEEGHKACASGKAEAYCNYFVKDDCILSCLRPACKDQVSGKLCKAL